MWRDNKNESRSLRLTHVLRTHSFGFTRFSGMQMHHTGYSSFHIRENYSPTRTLHFIHRPQLLHGMNDARDRVCRKVQEKCLPRNVQSNICGCANLAPIKCHMICWYSLSSYSIALNRITTINHFHCLYSILIFAINN